VRPVSHGVGEFQPLVDPRDLDTAFRRSVRLFRAHILQPAVHDVPTVQLGGGRALALQRGHPAPHRRVIGEVIPRAERRDGAVEQDTGPRRPGVGVAVGPLLPGICWS
jgi:hypothetical protein